MSCRERGQQKHGCLQQRDTRGSGAVTRGCSPGTTAHGPCPAAQSRQGRPQSGLIPSLHYSSNAELCSLQHQENISHHFYVLCFCVPCTRLGCSSKERRQRLLEQECVYVVTMQYKQRAICHQLFFCGPAVLKIALSGKASPPCREISDLIYNT